MRDDAVRYVIRRLLWLPVYLFLVSFMVFTVGRWGPGDPAIVVAGPRASEETLQRIRHDMGLDKPILVQYFNYMGDFIRGDFGKSMVQLDRSVKDLLWERIPISAPLVLSSLLIAIVVGTMVGLVASLKRGTWIDNSLIGFFLFFSSIPSLIFVQLLILVFALKLGLLPASWSGTWQSVFSLYAVIPVFTLSLLSIVGIARLVRTTTLIVLDENYVRFARAKGLPPWEVALKYVLRNSLMPLVTVVVLSIFTAVEGSLFVEMLYGIPGTGQFMVQAVFQRDYNVIMAFTMLVSFLFVIGNLVADVLYIFLDPRVSLS